MHSERRVVVVTGASSGIGRATAVEFARRGDAVVLAARREEALAAAVAECEAAGGTALGVALDVTDADAVEALAEHAVARFGRIDVWVNAAAVAVFGPFLDVPVADIRRVLDVDVMGYVHGSRAALTRMVPRGRGVLVNVSSVLGVAPQPYSHAYVMSKSAVRALSAGLRQELALAKRPGVHVCCVLPATVDTPIFRDAANYTGREITPLPPIHRPERVARRIVALARRPRREVVVGRAGWALVLPARIAPGLVERVMAPVTERLHLSRRHAASATPGNLHHPAPGAGAVRGGYRRGLRRR